MKRRVLIIGGYGEVGGRVSKKINLSKNVLYIAGRSAFKANEFIQREKLDAKAVELDISKIEKFDLSSIDLVLNCIEKCNENVLQVCLKYKVDYIDMSPSASVLRIFSGYKDQIVNAGIHLICGIGVASLSHLILEQARKEFDEIYQVDSFLTLGLGENHGKDAVNWMVTNLDKEIMIEDEKGERAGKSVERYRTMRTFSQKKHIFYQIDLLDQYINKDCYPDIRSNSWFSTDVNIINRYLIFLRKVKVLNLLKYRSIKTLFCSLFLWFLNLAHALKIGDNRYSVKLLVNGIINGKEQYNLYHAEGRENADLTSEMVADIINDYEMYYSENNSIYGIKYLKLDNYRKKGFIKYKVCRNFVVK